MGLRPGRCYRGMDKPAWTRYSRSKPKTSKIKAMPPKHVHHYIMGKKGYEGTLEVALVAKEDVQVRDNSLEAARTAINKHLETNIVNDYCYRIYIYPHQVLRENKMITGAGADRLQRGMAKAFGKPAGRAARVRRGKKIMSVITQPKNIALVTDAMKRGIKKLMGLYNIEIINYPEPKRIA